MSGEPSPMCTIGIEPCHIACESCVREYLESRACLVEN